MKRRFGSLLIRTLRGGANLSDEEHFLLQSLVDALPSELRSVVSAQFKSYNLVQREQDGHALNFHRVPLVGKPIPPGRLLEMKLDEAPLVGVVAQIKGETRPLHATLAAVHGRAFAVAFDRPVPRVGASALGVTKVSHSWLSNFRDSDADA